MVPPAMTAWLTGGSGVVVELPYAEMGGVRALGGRIIILGYIKFSGSHGGLQLVISGHQLDT